MQSKFFERKKDSTNETIASKKDLLTNLIKSPMKNLFFSFFDTQTNARLLTISKDVNGPSRENYFRSALLCLRKFICHSSINGKTLLENCSMQQSWSIETEDMYQPPKKIITYTTQTIRFPTDQELTELTQGKSYEQAFIEGVKLINVSLQIYLAMENFDVLVAEHPIFELLPFYYRYNQNLLQNRSSGLTPTCRELQKKYLPTAANVIETLDNLFFELGKQLLDYINSLSEQKFKESKEEILSTIKSYVKKGAMIDLSYVPKFENERMVGKQFEIFFKSEKIKLPHFKEIFDLILKNCIFCMHDEYCESLYSRFHGQWYYYDRALNGYISDDPDKIEVLILLLNNAKPQSNQVACALESAIESYCYRAVILLIGYHRKIREDIGFDRFFDVYMCDTLLKLLYHDKQKSLDMIKFLEDAGFNAKSKLLDKVQQQCATNEYSNILNQIVSPNKATIKKLK